MRTLDKYLFNNICNKLHFHSNFNGYGLRIHVVFVPTKGGAKSPKIEGEFLNHDELEF